MVSFQSSNAWLHQFYKKLGCVFFALFAAVNSFAATYAYRSDVFAYDTPTASATTLAWHTTTAAPACTNYPNGDDDWADLTFPGGFTFTFAGASYNGLRVYSNGILAFPTDASGLHRDFTSQSMPITAGGGNFGGGCPNGVPVNLMVPYWLDIVAGKANNTSNASVKYEVLGNSPNRRLVISWVNVKLYGQSARYNFQVALYEGAAGVNGNFKYQYTTGSSTGAGATVGVQVSTTDFTQYAFNQNFIDPVAGTAILWYPANQLAAKSAEYQFDEGFWNGTAGEIRDTSGNTRHATRVSSNVANVSAGKLCRGGTFTNNTSNAVIDAVATPLTPNSRGAVDFWYKSNVAWNDAGSDAMLLDATLNAARPFFLLKRSNGTLRFVLTDSAGQRMTAESVTAYSFAAGTWHHIGVSWSLNAGTNQTVMQILLDGTQIQTRTSTPFRATSSGAIDALGTVYIGDNRTSGVTPSSGSAAGANGTIDEVYFYDLEINATQAAADMALTRTTCTVLDHFHISHSGEVVNCGGTVANVTVQAHDANHAPISLAGATMTLSTSTGHGTWSGVSTINPVLSTPGTGGGSYTFANESTVIFGLSDAFVESLNINLNSGGITEHSGAAAVCVPADVTFGAVCDANLNFAQSGLKFSVPDHVADVVQSLTLRAVKKADNSDACTPEFANTTRSVRWSCSYLNPVTGTVPVRVAGVALNAANDSSMACDVAGQSLALTFDGSGVATTSLQYADVGAMTLNAETLSAGIVINGSDAFITTPKDFLIGGYPAGPIRAGSTFAATVTARNNANVATPNFGKEAVPESVNLSFTRAQPTGAGAVNGNFSGSVGAFNAGAASASNLAWSEVGRIDLTATLASGNYLGSGLSATGTTGGGGAVGAFVPDHFDVVTTQACVLGAFTYSGQPANMQVTAMNAAVPSAKTLNYDGTAATTPNFAKAITLSDAHGLGVGSFAPASFAASNFVAGVAAPSSAFTFSNPLTAPTAIAVRAVDADAVSSSGFAEGALALRSGRVRLQNVFGSEKLALQLPVQAQYWSGSYFVANAQDSCTVLAVPTAQTLGSGAAPAGTPALYFYPVVVSKNQLLSSDTSASLASPLTAGKTALRFTAPQKPGWLDVVLQVPGYLRGNWGNCDGQTGAAGALDDWPCARATFGIFGNAASPLIYRREDY